MDNLIKDVNNKINYFRKLKNEANTNKILCASYTYGMTNGIYYERQYIRVIIKRHKNIKNCTIEPAQFIKNKLKCYINNLAIDNLTIEIHLRYCNNYYNENYGINSLTLLTMLIYILKFMNITKLKLTLKISTINFHYPTYNAFCKSLVHILHKCCKDMYIIINCPELIPSAITNLEIISMGKQYATINKFRINHHRNFKLKSRVN